MAWISDVRKLGGPRYLAIADAVTRAIDSGELKGGARLPTHRDLAETLSLDVTTVTRAYAEIRRRGLVAGKVGNGTFVQDVTPDSPASPSLTPNDGRFIDLSHNFPSTAPVLPGLRQLREEILRNLDLGGLIGRQVDVGTLSHRAAGASWLSGFGVESTSEDVVITAGAQHGLMIALAALTRPGDTVLTEEMTFYGMRSAADMLGRNLAGVATDEQGLLPDDLAEKCQSLGSRVLYCTPTLHNPTTAIMSAARRKAVVEVCLDHGISVIEDDVYGFLVKPQRRPLWADLRNQCIYVTSLSKCLGPGLRVGYLRVPTHLRRAVGVTLRASTLMAGPIEAEIAARFIHGGDARRLADEQRARMEALQMVVKDVFHGVKHDAKPSAYHVWLHMPAGWHSRVFAAEARLNGIGVTPASFFCISPTHRIDAVRICLSAAPDDRLLRRALQTILSILQDSDSLSTQVHFV